MVTRYEIEDVSLCIDTQRDEWVRFFKHATYESPIEHNGHQWMIVSMPNITFLVGRAMSFVTIFRLKRELPC